MIRDILRRHIGPKWREPEFHAAVLNGALILLQIFLARSSLTSV